MQTGAILHRLFHSRLSCTSSSQIPKSDTSYLLPLQSPFFDKDNEKVKTEIEQAHASWVTTGFKTGQLSMYARSGWWLYAVRPYYANSSYFSPGDGDELQYAFAHGLEFAAATCAKVANLSGAAEHVDNLNLTISAERPKAQLYWPLMVDQVNAYPKITKAVRQTTPATNFAFGWIRPGVCLRQRGQRVEDWHGLVTICGLNGTGTNSLHVQSGRSGISCSHTAGARVYRYGRSFISSGQHYRGWQLLEAGNSRILMCNLVVILR
ncbi:hypothetical protein GG344DRAFT_62239 [Lentinula edodes]|nr:hypothetical protein GG344DRAFT_62239 [Lentinula edodes]